MEELLISLLEKLMRIGAQRVMADIVTYGIVGLIFLSVGIVALILWVKRRKFLPASRHTRDWNGYERDHDRWDDAQFCVFAGVAVMCLGMGIMILLFQLNTALAFDYETLKALRSLIR